jgi:hypothetical protein
MKIVAQLPANRLILGTWSLLNDDGSTNLGPFQCDGKSDNAAAAAHGNPTRDPRKAFGDTPTGNYIARLAHVPDTPENRYGYGLPDDSGAIPVIWLTPQEGDGTSDAWARQTSEGLDVNMGLAIHSGPPNGSNALRPTYGCLRTWEQDFTQVRPLVAGIGPFPVSIVEEEAETVIG